MNKSELVDALAAQYDGSRAEAARALGAVVHAISAATAAGERVSITGFGVFERVERPARTVRNPRTGERLQAPATAVPRFRAGTELKAYVAGQRPVPELAPAPTGRRSTPAARAVPAPAPEPVTAEEPARSARAGTTPTKINSSTKDDDAKAGKSKKPGGPDKSSKDKAGKDKADKSGKDKAKAKSGKDKAKGKKG